LLDKNGLLLFLITSAAVFDAGDKEISFGDDNSDLFTGVSPAATKVLSYHRLQASLIHSLLSEAFQKSTAAILYCQNFNAKPCKNKFHMKTIQKFLTVI